MEQLTRLFQPGMIGSLEVKNRIVMAPMGTGSVCKRCVSDQIIDYYVERAKGGVGLIITGVVSVWSKAAPQDHFAIYSDEFIPRFRELTSAIHKYNAKIAIQLGHLGIVASPHGYATSHLRYNYSEESIDVVGPSALPYLLTDVVPRELTQDEIEEMVEAFAECGRRAEEAGFDAIELHGGHGCLISMFLSPFTNKRTDRYGGSTEKRVRFARDIITRTREKLGTDFPILIRINGDDGIAGGTRIDEAVEQARLLEQSGARAIDISAGFHQIWPSTIPSYMLSPGLFVPMAAEVKKAISVPVITVGKLGDPVFADRVLQQGKADFIALGRPLLADPELPNKAREGRFQSIRKCIYCNNCMEQSVRMRLKGRGRACTVNPALFREREFTLKPATASKEVMVIGGGLAGMEAAKVLSQRGHRVSLYERGDRLGGQWNIACQEPWKRDYASVTEDLIQSLNTFGVRIILNKKVAPAMVKKIHPDVVVLATGAIPVTIDVPGADEENVCQANDVLTGKAEVGDTVVVIGGRYRGLETACFLAEQGKKVSLVTRRNLGRDINHYNYLPLREKIIQCGVQFYTDSQVIDMRENVVTILRSQEIISLKTDSVVLAVGAKPENRLATELEGIVSELYSIGDCIESRTALEAINEGAEVACMI